MCARKIQKSKMLFKACVMSTDSLALALRFTMTDLKHYIQIGSGRRERTLHLL